MSTLRANSIVNAAGNNTAQINGMTPTAQSLQGFRNRIINGDMRIDQRNNGASVTGNDGAFPIDRFTILASQTSKLTVQQSTLAPTGFSNSLLATSSSSYSVLSTDYFMIQQRIEGFNTSDLGFGSASASTITLSFWVRSSLTGTFGGALTNNAYNRSYPFSYVINSANTWEQKTVTIAGDTTGTWVGSTNGVGLRVSWSLGTGSTNLGTANSWVASSVLGVTGQVNLVGTNGATFYITGVQLEAGSVATPFERRDYGRELQMCQRYYQVLGNGSSDFTGVTNPAVASFGYTWPTSAVTLLLMVTMRAAPTATWVSGSNNGGGYAFVTMPDVVNLTAAAPSGYRYASQITASAEL